MTISLYVLKSLTAVQSLLQFQLEKFHEINTNNFIRKASREVNILKINK
jgi:hypothetical protein